jgi:hypothetical protein
MAQKKGFWDKMLERDAKRAGIPPHFGESIQDEAGRVWTVATKNYITGEYTAKWGIAKWFLSHKELLAARQRFLESQKKEGK